MHSIHTIHTLPGSFFFLFFTKKATVVCTPDHRHCLAALSHANVLLLLQKSTAARRASCLMGGWRVREQPYTRWASYIKFKKEDKMGNNLIISKFDFLGGHLSVPGGHDVRRPQLPHYLSGRWPLESSSTPVLCPLCRAPHISRFRCRPCFRLERAAHANDRCSLSVPVPENAQLHARLQEWDVVANSQMHTRWEQKESQTLH